MRVRARLTPMPATVRDIAVSEVDRSEVLRYLGYRGQELTPQLAGRLDELVAHALEVARPRASIRSFDVEARELDDAGTPVVRLRGCALVLAGHDVSRHLEGAVAVGLLAVTLGADTERELRRLSLTDHVAQVVFDAALTAIVERAADGAEALLVADAASRGLYTNWRYSPGYGDLPLSCQPTFLAVLDAGRRLGITLTPSLLMVPTKSVTALVGYFGEPQVGARTGCATCNLRDWCTLRARGVTCVG